MNDTQAGRLIAEDTGGRAAALTVLAGGSLMATTVAGFWSGPIVIPTAVASAMLVFGGARLLGRIGLARRARDGGRSGIGYFESDLDPVYLTDLSGHIRTSNPAGAAESMLDGRVPDPDGAVYRLCREARLNGAAVEPAADGTERISVIRYGSRSLLWRIERLPAPEPTGADFSSAPLPWIRLDAGDAVVQFNDAAADIAGGPPATLADLLTDGPLRPDAVHLTAVTGRALRAMILRETAGLRDVILVPLDGAEVSGLVPNHFLEDLPVALARLRPDGALTFANRAARQLLGAGAEPGVAIADLMEGLGRSISERIDDTNKGRALGRSEVARGRAEGQEIFLQVAFTRTVLDGEPALLAVLSDATELKTLEAQFVQSQKMQAVGQLAGGVAHDFNNLLTAINGHCDLLLMRHDVADVEHGDLMQIRQNANRAAALVRQLLAFSRKQTLRPTVISLQDTLSELAHLLNRLLSEKVVLRIENGPDLAPVRVDERQLEQVIMNLVVNSRDAMPRGGEVRITTRNQHLAEDLHRDRAIVLKGDYVVIEVADSGTGIPPDKLNKIFEPFFTTKQVGEGTGLGLSTAYGIIKQTGGFIFATNPPGGGAIFSVYLPAYERKAEAAPLPEPEAKRPRDLTGRGLVLLVEDEDAVRSFAARALQMRGYTVIEAASGEEALEVLEDETLHVDIMLSDVIMPGLDGPAWVREARKTRPDAKVIFMSGYAEDAFSGGDSGIPDASFLPKPFTLPELTERVKETLGC